MDDQQRDSREAGGAADGRGRGLRAFGLLRRRDPEAQTAEPARDEPHAELAYTLDPDVARRIAQFVGQKPSDTDLAWLQAR